MPESAFPRPLSSDERALACFRKPKRITITLADKPYAALVQRSGEEGRSLSNLAAFLLESSLLC